jgi:hypothetical protein
VRRSTPFELHLMCTSLLGCGTIEDILVCLRFRSIKLFLNVTQASDPNSKGKGKAKSSRDIGADDDRHSMEGLSQIESTSSKAYRMICYVILTFDTVAGSGDVSNRILFDLQFPSCGICGDIFRNTRDPFSASQTPSSSSNHAYGLCLPCPNQHAYCLSCLTSYIHVKLDPKRDGGGVMENIVFPITCPECPAGTWKDGIEDEVAQRILGDKGMVLWVSIQRALLVLIRRPLFRQNNQKFLDSLPRLFCPNIRCSASLQVHEDASNPQAQCPACNVVMCTSCKTRWHESKVPIVWFFKEIYPFADLSCEEFQASLIPLGEIALTFLCSLCL